MDEKIGQAGERLARLLVDRFASRNTRDASRILDELRWLLAEKREAPPIRSSGNAVLTGWEFD